MPNNFGFAAVCEEMLLIACVGMMFGGYVWGTLSDIQGRRKVLLWSLSVNALGGALSALAQQTWMFILMRFLSGIG